MKSISWSSIVFVSTLLLMSGVICMMSARGAFLPRADENSELSLRNVKNRRTHFFTYHSFGK